MTRPLLELGKETCADLGEASRREWLETNGLGGFASSTVAGLNTRRYHGLLTAATHPPVGRAVLLSKLEETLVIDGRRHDLSTNQYPGAIHPRGYTLLESFRLDPFPVFTYEVEDIEIEKTVFMVHGENTTVVQYKFKSARNEGLGTDDNSALGTEHSALSFELRPLIAFRDYHSTTRENGAINSEFAAQDGLVTLTPYEGMPALHLAHDAGEVERAGFWYRNFEYAIERERGLDFTEDLFNPCVLTFDLSGRDEVNIIASTERREAARAAEYRAAEIGRREDVVGKSPSSDEFVRALVAAADSYVVGRGERQTVIAGYHWFGDWGRDTMIALPGLTLATGRTEVARSILSEFARHVDQGMLPNRFPEAGAAPEYNTVDATLWYFNAVHEYLSYTGDHDFVRAELYEVLRDIIDWHERGTRYRIHVDEAGLLYAGEPGVQLTWMDAKIGDWVVTPRTGKAVEIQALWYNALRVMEALAREFGRAEDERKFGAMAARAHGSFNEQFWDEERGCLYDVVDGDARAASLRPNQIIAASLPYTCLSDERARRVVEAVERELLTPYGLRSLAPADAAYRGRYEGDGRSRDSVYHQGTVWGWLMGPFVTAYVRAHGRSEESRRRAAAWLAPFREHLRDAGLNHVSEIFDGDAPHAPRGCMAQAWSVAEVLRALVADVGEVSGEQ